MLHRCTRHSKPIFSHPGPICRRKYCWQKSLYLTESGHHISGLETPGDLGKQVPFAQRGHSSAMTHSMTKMSSASCYGVGFFIRRCIIVRSPYRNFNFLQSLKWNRSFTVRAIEECHSKTSDKKGNIVRITTITTADTYATRQNNAPLKISRQFLLQAG